MIDVGLRVRPAQVPDRQRIASLMHYEPYVHRHLDWRIPLDWLGVANFWVGEQKDNLISALACPPDPANIAWIRLFASSGQFSFQESWLALWQTASDTLYGSGNIAAAIAMQTWFADLLRKSGFVYAQHIVMLEFNDPVPLTPHNVEGVRIRPMLVDDLPEVSRVDAASFKPLWQNSLPALGNAFSMAGWATVAESDAGIIGYQISTYNVFGAHLARLAVVPAAQGLGVGRALIVNLNHAIAARGLRRITVNTQGDNAASLALYKKVGFSRTLEEYPVYLYEFQAQNTR